MPGQSLPPKDCEICHAQPKTVLQCRICGASVCEACINGDLCLNCDESKCQICGEYLSSRACNKCGILVCEDHGTRMNEVTLCDNCGA